MSKAEEYADLVLQQNYGYDENDIPEYDNGDSPFDLDDRMDPPVRYRDARAWLIQGHEAGQREMLDYLLDLDSLPTSEHVSGGYYDADETIELLVQRMRDARTALGR